MFNWSFTLYLVNKIPKPFFVISSMIMMTFMAGLTTPVSADDTEIYNGQFEVDIRTLNPEEFRPNILFVLDRSGSMNWYDYDEQGNKKYGGTKRIERLKEALLRLLDEMKDVNIGFMTFTGIGDGISERGAAIQFPISFIDDPAANVKGESDLPPQLQTTVGSSSDDAEEKENGTVILDDANLEMTRFLPQDAKTVVHPNIFAGSKGTIRESVGGSSSYSTGAVRVGDVARYFGGKDGAVGEVISGLRFANMNIPKGAKILSADITFTSINNTESNMGELLIRGAANPPEIDDPADKYKNSGLGITANWTNMTTTTTSWKSVPTWSYGKSYSISDDGVDLTGVIQEVIDHDSWTGENDALGFTFIRSDHANGFAGTGIPNFGHFREFCVHGKTSLYKCDSSRLPKLSITYTTAAVQNQKIGLRFDGVRIIQGATIQNAILEFTSGADETGGANFVIHGERSGHSEPFKNEARNISSRPLTSKKVAWEENLSWKEDNVYSSPDLKEVVQEIVSNGNWCGGNAMSLIVSAKDGETPLRNVISFDQDITKAPVLKIQYSVDDVPANACMKSEYLGRVASDGDAEERIRDETGSQDNTMFLGSDTLEMTTDKNGTKRIVGFRFPNIPVKQGTNVLRAELVFNGIESGDGDSAVLKLSAENVADSGKFLSDPGNLSSRKKTSSVTWRINDDWEDDKKYSTGDDASVTTSLTNMVQSIISKSQWQPFNSLSFFIEGDGLRKAMSADAGDPSKAVLLKLEIDGSLAQGGSSGSSDDYFTTVRDRLKEMIGELKVSGWTPLVDAIYEAGMYFTGGQVHFGSSRYTAQNWTSFQSYFNSTLKSIGWSWDRASSYFQEKHAKNLVSHPGSWTGGILDRPINCPGNNSWEAACVDEKIKGTANYIVPEKARCANNYIVFLTDGAATQNQAKSKIRQFLGAECTANYTTEESGLLGQPFRHKYDEYRTADIPSKNIWLNDFLQHRVNGDEECGVDMVRYLHEELDITLHTIGFGLSEAYLPTEKSGSEKWVLSKERTRENKRAVSYLKEWAAVGGGNFFQASSVDDLLNAFRSVISQAVVETAAFAAPSVSVSNFNKLYHRNEVYFAIFKPDKKPYWDGNVKKYGLSVCHGDEGCESGLIVDKDGMPAVDYNTGAIKDSATSIWSSDPDGPIVTQGGAGAKLNRSSSRIVYTYTGAEDPIAGQNHDIELFLNETDEERQIIGGHRIHLNNEDLTKNMLLGDMTLTEDQANERMTDDERGALIDWIVGSSREWAFGDALHSSPISVTYGGTEENPDTRLFVGTNDGLIRMINAETGREEWAFLPPELLPMQADLMKNQPQGGRIYGIDGSPSVRIKDRDRNNKIEKHKGDYVQLFIGMRRGGRNIYALDVTVPDEPKLMWVIRGGQSGYERLGYTWSAPLLGGVNMNKVCSGKPPCTALIFGGGYDNSVDPATEGADSGGITGDFGNAVYIAKPDTGELMWTATNKEQGVNADLKLNHMTHAIPSNMRLVDVDKDNIIDRLYFGDIGGQVWRIDLNDGNKSVGARLGNISGTDVTEKRHFFYRPAVSKIECNDVDRYVVAITSGTRPHPLDEKIRNQFYVFNDKILGGLVDNDNNGNADGFVSIDHRRMLDATAVVGKEEQTPEGDAGLNPTEVEKKLGWYVDLRLDASGNPSTWIGEKGLASPVILNTNNTVFFTTYIPSGEVTLTEDGCSGEATQGTSRIYALDVCDASANYKEGTMKRLNGFATDISIIVLENNEIRMMSNDPTLVRSNMGDPIDAPDDDGSGGSGNGSSGSSNNGNSPLDIWPMELKFWRQEG